MIVSCQSRSKKSQSGFSLVELMVVVAIIGILSALAVPKFRNFQAKAKQAEAKTNLVHIYTLEQSYFGDNDVYTTMPKQGGSGGSKNKCNNNKLGFVLSPCEKARYTYQVTTGNSDTTFTATATSGTGDANGILPGCKSSDRWQIDQDNIMKPMSDVTTKC